MDCDRAREVVFLIVDEDLEPEVSQDFENHISHCPHCARRSVYTRRLIAVVRERCTRHAAPERLRLRILTSFSHRNNLGS